MHRVEARAEMGKAEDLRRHFGANSRASWTSPALTFAEIALTMRQVSLICHNAADPSGRVGASRPALTFSSMQSMFASSCDADAMIEMLNRFN